jgi:transcriptional regulator with XRE-family HTH domain
MLEHAPIVNALTFDVNSFTERACNLDYMSDVPATLGERIQTWRKAAGFRTQQQLADHLGCKRETVTMWETNKVDRVGGDYIGPLSIALGKSPQMIQKGREGKLTREGSTAPASPQLEAIREPDAIQSLRIFVGAIATVMASTRSDEGEALLSLVRSAAGADEFVNRGLGLELVQAVERGIALAKARQSSRRRGAA